MDAIAVAVRSRKGDPKVNSADLKRLFGLNHRVLHINLEGVTNDEALVQPQSAGNCINWVVGHLVATRGIALVALGSKPSWPVEEASRYQRHSPPIAGPGDGAPFDRLVQEFDRSQVELEAALGALSDADLARVHENNETLGQRLAFLHFHEAYHLGQLGLLRRIAGKEGAIK